MRFLPKIKTACFVPVTPFDAYLSVYTVSILYMKTFITPPKNVEGLYFHSLQFVCVSVCLCVCLSSTACEQNPSQTDEFTDLDAIFVKRLLSTLARTRLKLVTLGQMSRSQWLQIHFFFIILC